MTTLCVGDVDEDGVRERVFILLSKIPVDLEVLGLSDNHEHLPVNGSRTANRSDSEMRP